MSILLLLAGISGKKFKDLETIPYGVQNCVFAFVQIPVVFLGTRHQFYDKQSVAREYVEYVFLLKKKMKELK